MPCLWFGFVHVEDFEVKIGGAWAYQQGALLCTIHYILIIMTSCPGTCSDLDKETNSLLQDFEMCVQRLRAAEADRDRFKKQHEKSLSELQQRAERISRLECQRTKILDILNDMDGPVNMYYSD